MPLLKVSVTLVKLFLTTNLGKHRSVSIPVVFSFPGHHIRVVQMSFSEFGIFHVMQPRISPVMFNIGSNVERYSVVGGTASVEFWGCFWFVSTVEILRNPFSGTDRM